LKEFPYAAEPLSEYLSEYLPDDRFDEEFFNHIQEKLPKEDLMARIQEILELVSVYTVMLSLLPLLDQWFLNKNNLSQLEQDFRFYSFIGLSGFLLVFGASILTEAKSKKILFHQLLRCSVLVDWKDRELISFSVSNPFFVKTSWRIARIGFCTIALVILLVDRNNLWTSLFGVVGCFYAFLSLMYAKIIDMDKEMVPFSRLIESPFFMKRIIAGWKDVIVITEKELAAYFIEKAEPSQKKFASKVLKIYEENEKKRRDNDKEGKTSKKPKPESILGYYVISHTDIDTWLKNYRQRPAEKVKSSRHVFSYLKFIIYTSKAAESFGVKQPLKSISETAEMKTREEPEIKK
jgi:hypothetical protein